ncbi:MAG: hypothetical protein WC934_14805 [Acidithiobacillus sp.]|jgi:hypothetical protein|uniref:hypothetical protein n=1 Tax=Acidithiobacillus sp. TaxID=1872118 RepID=UPI003560CFF3
MFPTKNHWKENSDLTKIDEGLNNLKSKLTMLCNCNFPKIVNIPALGCGYGQLKYNDVKKLIFKKFNVKDSFSNLNFSINLFRPW